MEFKNFPMVVVSVLCLFLMVLLVINMLENHHYEKILVDRAETIINQRMKELEMRFETTAENGRTAFSEIDQILTNEATSVEEARELIGELDIRLKEADELITILSYHGAE
ncbi:MAG: hypothetical protein JEY99_16720 [Spirochaetales bacterium]|nr:hypothetical protein [Spirochaetales bacterium]